MGTFTPYPRTIEMLPTGDLVVAGKPEGRFKGRTWACIYVTGVFLGIHTLKLAWVRNRRDARKMATMLRTLGRPVRYGQIDPDGDPASGIRFSPSSPLCVLRIKH